MVTVGKRFILCIILFVFSSFFMINLVGATSLNWSNTYGNPEDDVLFGLIEISDGGFAMVGYANSSDLAFDFGYFDVYFVCTYENGAISSSSLYGGEDYDLATALVEVSNGGFAIAGSTGSYGKGLNDFWLIKNNSTGNWLWSHTYGGEGHDHATALVEVSDGGFAIAGYTDSYGEGLNDFWLIKTDSDGNMLWNQTYGGENNEYGTALVEVSDGGFAIAGYTDSYGEGLNDFWLIKTDSDGNMLWNQTYGGENNEYATALVEVSDGGFAIAGYTYSYGVGYEGDRSDFWLIKTNEFGIVPEFQSWTILPLFIAITFTITIFRKISRR